MAMEAVRSEKQLGSAIGYMLGVDEDVDLAMVPRKRSKNGLDAWAAEPGRRGGQTSEAKQVGGAQENEQPRTSSATRPEKLYEENHHCTPCRRALIDAAFVLGCTSGINVCDGG